MLSLQRLTFRSAATSLVVLSISFFLASCTLLAELAPVNEDTSQVRDWIVVPVFYATTRKRAPSKSIDFLEQRAVTGLQFGVKNIVVPAPVLTPVSEETMKRMGWRMIHLEKPLPQGNKPEAPAPEECAFPDKEYINNEVVAGFDKYRADSGSNKVVFFVHGCCATFQASLERSAKIASHMQVPLVVYDWASPKGFTKYLENETCVEQTNDDFYDFLNSIEAVVPAANTTLIGHSMGARFLDVALLRRSERTRFGIPVSKYEELIFSQPDIDARAYIRHNPSITSQAKKTRIYFNVKDGRLDASATAHGGFERLGRPGLLLDKLCKIDNQDLLDITQCAMGHEIPFWVLAAISNPQKDKSTKIAGFNCKEAGAHHFVLEKI